MAKEQAPSQQQIPSTESEHLNEFVEPFALTPPEVLIRTSTSKKVPEAIRARDDERRYATHWGINE